MSVFAVQQPHLKLSLNENLQVVIPFRCIIFFS